MNAAEDAAARAQVMRPQTPEETAMWAAFARARANDHAAAGREATAQLLYEAALIADEQAARPAPVGPEPWAADDLANWLAYLSEPVVSMKDHMALLEVAIKHASSALEAERRAAHG